MANGDGRFPNERWPKYLLRFVPVEQTETGTGWIQMDPGNYERRSHMRWREKAFQRGDWGQQKPCLLYTSRCV